MIPTFSYCCFQNYCLNFELVRNSCLYEFTLGCYAQDIVDLLSHIILSTALCDRPNSGNLPTLVGHLKEFQSSLFSTSLVF